MPQPFPRTKPKRPRTTASAPRRACGRSLADFGRLSATERKLLDCCRRGTIMEIGDETPTEGTTANSIRASLVRFLALGGDERAPVHEAGVVGRGAGRTRPAGA